MWYDSSGKILLCIGYRLQVSGWDDCISSCFPLCSPSISVAVANIHYSTQLIRCASSELHCRQCVHEFVYENVCELAGEVLPQAVCRSYGLQVGSYSALFVRLLMALSSPISWPIGKLLDWLLGEEHSVSVLVLFFHFILLLTYCLVLKIFADFRIFCFYILFMLLITFYF